MRYLLACVHSWWWHLTYGMWKGCCETRLSLRGQVCALYSSDRDRQHVKVFWQRPGADVVEWMRAVQQAVPMEAQPNKGRSASE